MVLIVHHKRHAAVVGPISLDLFTGGQVMLHITQRLMLSVVNTKDHTRLPTMDAFSNKGAQRQLSSTAGGAMLFVTASSTS